MFNFSQGYSVYDLLEMYKNLQAPVHEFVENSIDFFQGSALPVSTTQFGRAVLENLDALNDLSMIGEHPGFHIKETICDDAPTKISEEILAERSFCNLLHFKKVGKEDRKEPRILIFAPMAGHYATLLRGTVEGLLPYADIYITDWKSASAVPLSEGGFDLEDYISYAIDFMRDLSEDGPLDVLAVCQPCVPVLAATARMAMDDVKSGPANLILMGGPVDARICSTEVNKMAEEHTSEWFTNNLITLVPHNYPGAMRAVYPGYLQLAGFLSMNMPRHLESAARLYRNIALGSEDDTDMIADFYKEYFAVMDLAAEFYIQTIDKVFKEYALAKGTLEYRGERIDLSAIKNTRILAIEGEKDDIAGVGQTKAALKLCKNVPASKKEYYMQKNVGHYGIFNGSRYRKEVVPKILKFIG